MQQVQDASFLVGDGFGFCSGDDRDFGGGNVQRGQR